jgi:tetratricopeptide (TPR) repeat protein
MEIRRENLSINDYTKMIAIDPYNYNLYVDRGLLYSINGDFNKAKDDFAKAIQINPSSFEAYNNRGNIYRQEKQYDLAISDYTMCTEINPNAVQGYINRGSVYDDMYDYKLAIKDFSHAITIDPTDYEIYLFRWKAYNALGEEKLAETDLKKAFEINSFTTEQWFRRHTNKPINPDSPEAHIQNGLELLGSHEYDMAIAEFTEAIKIGSQSDAIAFNNRGMAHTAKNEYTLALDDYQKAITIDPIYTKAYSNIGILYWNVQEYDNAIENLTQAIKLIPDLVAIDSDTIDVLLNSLFYRGLSYKQTRKYYLAKIDFEKILNINPNDLEVKKLLIDVSAWT